MCLVATHFEPRLHTRRKCTLQGCSPVAFAGVAGSNWGSSPSSFDRQNLGSHLDSLFQHLGIWSRCAKVRMSAMGVVFNCLQSTHRPGSKLEQLGVKEIELEMIKKRCIESLTLQSTAFCYPIRSKQVRLQRCRASQSTLTHTDGSSIGCRCTLIEASHWYLERCSSTLQLERTAHPVHRRCNWSDWEPSTCIGCDEPKSACFSHTLYAVTLTFQGSRR
jgi:hypothetical protein